MTFVPQRPRSPVRVSLYVLAIVASIIVAGFFVIDQQWMRIGGLVFTGLAFVLMLRDEVRRPPT